ncbi:hypothetical protein DCCM_4875 [Desulfocucumis palustris]|uniref:Uncharacterized protein n=1 Tax=Desulfocucumis palustris TaxID=1898651 RepID=A0A2L2XHU7_9FIRM|nr:hypothetical protein DCCM_4875 [Desulfocucumis palustris]
MAAWEGVSPDINWGHSFRKKLKEVDRLTQSGLIRGKKLWQPGKVCPLTLIGGAL